MKKNQKYIFIALVVLLFIGFRLAQSLREFVIEEKRRESFAPRISKYLQYGFDDPVREGEAYISGRLVTVDVDERAVDYWTYSKLPVNLRANHPRDVGTVALIKWEWKKVGQYQNQETGEEFGDAFRSRADLILIDWQEHLVIGKKEFLGDEPVSIIRVEEGEKDGYASHRPMFKIVDYLKGLPRR